ncbi:MarR family winged helix-turn-helix transcriptional regulator [Longispora albida]|uniref:MarR family winged helix-turn-helix transcriptional regulator n=1 Tax=Longispora albida TaxID=203523 RepID=UPI000360037A|nr:MarR family transcriptional regulator [Longispora albida]
MLLGIYIRRLEQLLVTARTEALREFGLTVPQHMALHVLAGSPGNFSAAQLARVSFVTPQTMSTIITNLEAKGLITREPSEVHAQVLVLRVTETGLDLLHRSLPRMQEIEDRLQASFTEAERESFREFLTRSIGALT